jgi:hypothetical protein
MNGIWVRSQDKWGPWLVVGFQPGRCGDEYEITGYISNGHYHQLGVYPTETRALEVLDEIHKILDNNILQIVDEVVRTIPINTVYQMPAE